MKVIAEDSGSTETHTGTETHSEDSTGDHSGDHSGEHTLSEQDKEHAYERQAEFGTKDPHEFEFQSQSKNAGTEDHIQLKFKVEEGSPQIKIEYSFENDSTHIESSFRLQLYSIVEYKDNGTQGDGYQSGVDTVIGNESSYKLADQQWNNFEYAQSDVNGYTLYTVTASTVDGVVKLVLKLSTGIVDVNSTTLVPDSLKFDFEIHNFPYAANDSSLALVTKIKSESQQEVQNDTTHEKAGFSSNEAEVNLGGNAFFSWVQSALADGTSVPVVASSLVNTDNQESDLSEGEHSTKMSFAFIATNASDIVWDPEVGVVSQSAQEILAAIVSAFGTDSNGNPNLPGFGIWQALLLLAISTPIVRRRYNKTQ